MTAVAAIDCGTNSIRLLIIDTGDGPAGHHEVLRTMRIVRLGQGVDRTGLLAVEAIERTRVALAEYRQLLTEHRVSAVRMVATSAIRDAANRDEFVAMVQSTLGVAPEVVSGLEEASLSFTGAVAGLPALRGRVLVTDIGGGSSELVLGAVDPSGPGASLSAYSMDIGCVRLTERHLRDDPPTAPQLAEARADIEASLAVAAGYVTLGGAATLVGVAGSVTTMAAMALRLSTYDSLAIHAAVITRAQIAELTDWLSTAGRQERAAVPVMHPGRVDVIAAGGLILSAVMDACSASSITVSEHDILDGIAASLTG